jgi:SAM-dependent methyltransferase
MYERYMVPMLFAPYADDLTARVAALAPNDVLEVAAGTGVVTRRLADTLPTASITATDLSSAMVEYASTKETSRTVTWRDADIMALPFADERFDVVVCQFGVMFLPDRPHGYAELRRVLRPGGALVCNTWTGPETNDFMRTTMAALTQLFPQDPPVELAAKVHGYHDETQIRADLAAGGFDPGAVEIELLELPSRAATNDDPAIAYCQGSPMRDAIETRHPGRLDDATAAVAAAIAHDYGTIDLDARMGALVVTATNR